MFPNSTLNCYNSCTEYEERLNKCKADLVTKTLDDLYADKSIVRTMMDENYKPERDSFTKKTFRALKLGMKRGSGSSNITDDQLMTAVE